MGCEAGAIQICFQKVESPKTQNRRNHKLAPFTCWLLLPQAWPHQAWPQQTCIAYMLGLCSGKIQPDQVIWLILLLGLSLGQGWAQTKTYTCVYVWLHLGQGAQPHQGIWYKVYVLGLCEAKPSQTKTYTYYRCAWLVLGPGTSHTKADVAYMFDLSCGMVQQKKKVVTKNVVPSKWGVRLVQFKYAFKKWKA